MCIRDRPKAVDADVNILLLVLSCTWVSKPITASQDSKLFIIKSFFINIIGYKVKEEQNISKNIKWLKKQKIQF